MNQPDRDEIADIHRRQTPHNTVDEQTMPPFAHRDERGAHLSTAKMHCDWHVTSSLEEATYACGNCDIRVDPNL